MRRHPRLMNQINVVPYIDVMLVLLVIFMVTAPLMNPGVIDLPTIGKASAPPAQPIEISIRASGALSYIDRDLSNAERPLTDRDELLKVIKSKQAKKPNQPVVISADKDVKYEAVIEVMDLLQQNRVKRLGLLAKPRSG
ncbi:MAG TPA: protein TolR [Burkholderiales bacterium]|jgi:biopolymer transport protein TolR|nr:protein TolR [Burkholderiales bacterium]